MIIDNLYRTYWTNCPDFDIRVYSTSLNNNNFKHNLCLNISLTYILNLVGLGIFYSISYLIYQNFKISGLN